MKLEGTIQKEKRKKESRRKREKLIQKVLYTVIGIPYSKIEKMHLDFQTKRWEKDEEKSKQKVVNELINYIKKELARDEDGCYFIYNNWRSDEIDYGNSICLHYFPYETKHSKKMKIFMRVFMDKRGETYDAYFNYFFQAIQAHFNSYEDMNVTTGIEKHWSREYEYVKLAFKKKEENS